MKEHSSGDRGRRAIDEIEILFSALERLLGMRVTVHDTNGFFCTPEGSSLLHADRIYHRVEFCQIHRFLNDSRTGEEKCLKHDWVDGNRQAAKEEGAFLWGCWRGPGQIVVPLRRDGRHLASIFIGPFLPKSEQVDAGRPDATLPRYDLQRFGEDAVLLNLVAAGIVEKGVDALRLHGKGDRWDKIYHLVISRYPGKLTLADAAQTLCLSPSRAGHVIHDLFGVTFEDLLLAHRIRRAKALLETTDLSLMEISAAIGFCDVHHFSKTFKARTGITPGQYRIHHRQAGEGPSRNGEGL